MTGERPFRGNVRMLIHQVLSEEAPRPRKLNNNIPRDVETICLKCLEKNRERRYATAAELADDLRRHLCGDVVHARPPSAVYRAQKFVRRHRGPVGAGVALAVALVLGVIGTTIGMNRAFSANQRLDQALTDVTAERDRADAEAEWSYRVASVMANPFSDEEQVERFAGEWEARLNEVRTLVGTDHPDLIRQETLYAVWGWTLTYSKFAAESRPSELRPRKVRREQLRTWGPRVERAYHRAANRFSPDDPLRAALINGHIQWCITGRGETSGFHTDYLDYLPPETWEQIAPLYDELVASLSAIDSQSALRMAAQRVAAYQRARQSGRAAAAMREYLALRRQGGRPSRILGLEHEKIIQAFEGSALVDPVIYGEFMWRNYLDATHVYPKSKRSVQGLAGYIPPLAYGDQSGR